MGTIFEKGSINFGLFGGETGFDESSGVHIKIVRFMGLIVNMLLHTKGLARLALGSILYIICK